MLFKGLSILISALPEFFYENKHRQLECFGRIVMLILAHVLHVWIVFYFKILKRQRYYRSVLAFIIIYLQAKQPKIALALSFLQETYFYSVCAETLKKLHKKQNKVIFITSFFF